MTSLERLAFNVSRIREQGGYIKEIRISPSYYPSFDIFDFKGDTFMGIKVYIDPLVTEWEIVITKRPKTYSLDPKLWPRTMD